MARFTPHTVDSAPAAAKSTLQTVAKAYGFIPNLHGVFAEAPAVLEGYLALSSALDQSTLSAGERQVVLLAASVENGCTYCVAAHSMVARRQKVPTEVVDAIRDGTPVPDERLAVLAAVTRRVVRDRGWLSDAEAGKFLAVGYTKAQLLEVIGHVGLKTISNYVNHLAQTPLDPAFAAHAWQRPLAGAA